MKYTGIAVVEGIWKRKQNWSVRELFGLIANIYLRNPNAYHYEMATSEGALKASIPRILSYPECKYLYFAMHGDEKSLEPAPNETLSRSELRNLLQKNGSKSLKGVFLGTCKFGSPRLAKFLLEESTIPVWVAGYSTDARWVESSALDLLFFNELLSCGALREKQKIVEVASILKRKVPGLIADLGFGIFTRDAEGTVFNLFDAADGPEGQTDEDQA